MRDLGSDVGFLGAWGVSVPDFLVTTTEFVESILFGTCITEDFNVSGWAVNEVVFDLSCSNEAVDFAADPNQVGCPIPRVVSEFALPFFDAFGCQVQEVVSNREVVPASFSKIEPRSGRMIENSVLSPHGSLITPVYLAICQMTKMIF